LKYPICARSGGTIGAVKRIGGSGEKPMRILIHFALVFTMSLFVLRALAFPEIEMAAQSWSQIGAAVHGVGVQ
jgi:hypothetical protein